MTTIIGFAGRKRAGKNTAANWVLNNIDQEACVEAFADEVKRQVQKSLFEVLGVDTDPWNDKNPKMRRALQVFGTEFIREYDPDGWVNFLMRDIDEWNNEDVVYQPDYVLITDVRFPNEVQAIKDRGGYVIWIYCDPGVLEDRTLRLDGVLPQDTHASENSINRYDCDFFVNSTDADMLDLTMRYTMKRIEEYYH